MLACVEGSFSNTETLRQGASLRSPIPPLRGARARSRGPRVNEDIRVREVRLIDEDGTQVGVVPTQQALARAREQGLDLIEISPTAVPPVTKILDFGKFKYEQSRRRQDSRKKQKAGTVKEVRFRPRTSDHDLEFLVRRLGRFLQAGNKVKATVRFRGRERANPQLGVKVLERVKADLAEFGEVERDVTTEQDGRVISIIMAPTSH
jgi:translation initiation factor IF-3